MTHRTDEYWREPHTLDPDRVLPPRAEHRAHSHAHLPFGGLPEPTDRLPAPPTRR